MTSARTTEQLKHLLDLVTTHTGFTKDLGVTIDAVGPGQVTLSLNRREDLLQFSDVFHGGLVATLADHAAGAAVTTLLPEGRIAMSVDLQVNFLAPAAGDQLVARAKTVEVGGTIAVARVDVTYASPEGERLCAIATVTLRNIAMPAALVDPGNA